MRIRAPGEPFRDADRSGRWEPGEEWVNLVYPRDAGRAMVVDATDNLRDDGRFAGAPVRNAHGPAVDGAAAVAGVLLTSGRLETRGGVTVYGGVVAAAVDGDGAAPGDTPVFIWDASIPRLWPPAGWELPRTMVISRDTGPTPVSP